MAANAVNTFLKHFVKQLNYTHSILIPADLLVICTDVSQCQIFLHWVMGGFMVQMFILNAV